MNANHKCRLDHLVIAATTLQEGVDYVQDKFGVDIPAGGQHLNMATHNHVMQLGNSVFLEVIAAAPELEGNPQYVSRPRWFALDEARVQQSIAESPRLIAWVVNTDDLQQVSAASTFSLGTVTPVSRGDLNWLFALPADGRLLAAGALPYVMQWQTDSHPSQRMKDLGITLKHLKVAHRYPQWLKQRLDEIAASHLIEVEATDASNPPQLTAVFEVADGSEVVLHSAQH